MMWYPAAKTGNKQQLNTSNTALFMMRDLLSEFNKKRAHPVHFGQLYLTSVTVPLR